MNISEMDTLVAEIRAIMDAARANLSREVNTTMLNTYWQIGRTIVEREQNGNLKAEYGKKLLPELSKRLTAELGRGYSRSNLYNMRELYLRYPIFQTASGKLSWSHYLELLKAYVLIDLKMSDLRIEHAGQMNAYLNYYKTEINDEGDNPPVGIILCKTSKDVVAEYALGGLSNQVFASSYVYYIPDKDALVSEVKTLLAQESNVSEVE